jgi:hypothetical protein
MRVQDRHPDLVVVQVPDVTGTYHVGLESVSRNTRIDAARYVEWGLDRLAAVPDRVRGDYLCTSPVSAAVFARSIPAACDAIRAGLRSGRPGPWALAYAGLNVVRLLGLCLRAELGVPLRARRR